MSLNYKLYWETWLLIPNITDESWIEWIKAIESYKQRILSIMNNNDYAFMPINTKSYNEVLFDIYKELWIEFINPENIIYVDYYWSISSSILDQYDSLSEELSNKNINLFPFINSDKIDTLSRTFNLQTTRNHFASEIINDKSTAQQELRDLGVLTPEWKTVYTEQQAEHYFKELKNKWYESVTLKLKRAASWMWVFKINTLDELEKKIYEHRHEIDEWILMDWWIEWKFVSSPNIQYSIWKNKEEDVFIWSSSQILSPDGTVHLWNISDLEVLKNKKLQKDLDIVREWIRSKWAQWIVGIDFSIFEDDSWEQKAYFMEINWRINWSTHGSIIASKIYEWEEFNDKWSVVNNIVLPENTTTNDFIQKLQRDNIYYDPSTKTWVLPTNISAIDKYSKAMVVIFGEKDSIRNMINILNTY